MALLTLTAAAASTPAAPPLLNEDAGIASPGQCEGETGASRLRAAGGSGREAGFGVECGVLAGTQIGAGFSRASVAGARSDGLGLAGKTQVWSGDERSVALTYGLGWTRGGGRPWSWDGWDVGGVYSGEAGRYGVVHVNLGYARDRGAGEGLTYGALGFEHHPFTAGGIGIAPVAEVFGDSGGSRWWNLGLRFELVHDRAWLGLGHARQFAGDERARNTHLALKLAF